MGRFRQFPSQPRSNAQQCLCDCLELRVEEMVSLWGPELGEPPEGYPAPDDPAIRREIEAWGAWGIGRHVKEFEVSQHLGPFGSVDELGVGWARQRKEPVLAVVTGVRPSRVAHLEVFGCSEIEFCGVAYIRLPRRLRGSLLRGPRTFAILLAVRCGQHYQSWISGARHEHAVTSGHSNEAAVTQSRTAGYRAQSAHSRLLGVGGLHCGLAAGCSQGRCRQGHSAELSLGSSGTHPPCRPF